MSICSDDEFETASIGLWSFTLDKCVDGSEHLHHVHDDLNNCVVEFNQAVAVRTVTVHLTQCVSDFLDAVREVYNQVCCIEVN